MRWLNFAYREPRLGTVAVVEGLPYKFVETGWERLDLLHRAAAARRMDTSDGLRAAEVAARKKMAAPSWGDLIHEFGEQGVVRNERGKIVGYRYPKYDDRDRSQRVAQTAYEMWEPHRRVSVTAGAEVNAGIRLTTLVKPETGQVKQVDERAADVVARTQGFTTPEKHFTGGV